MVKGINKQMVFLRLDGNSTYESACFILKNEAKHPSEADKDMLAEANRIVFELEERKRKKPSRSRLARIFVPCASLFIGLAAGFFLSSWLF